MIFRIEVVDVDEGLNCLHGLGSKTLDDAVLEFYNLISDICSMEDEQLVFKLDMQKEVSVPASDEDIMNRLKIDEYIKYYKSD